MRPSADIGQLESDIELIEEIGRMADPHDKRDPVAAVMVPIAELSVSGSIREAGENPEHVRALASCTTELPPILVHHPTMRVIDGVHRLSAAKLRGEDRIAVTFFYGDESEAFILAVRANSRHGLPLSQTERKSAADRIADRRTFPKPPAWPS